MKKALITVFILFTAVASFAQVTKDEVNYIQSIWGMDKRDIIKDFLKLTDEESKGFWPLYDKYEDARKEIGKERIKSISDWAQNVSSLTDAQIDEIAQTTFSNHAKFTNLLKNTYTMMKDVIPVTKAAQFVQVEIYLETSIRLAIQGELPVIGDIKKK
ncbi:MAG: hypothetical protein MUE56_01615 [Ignavibacteria bacterium]|jgi:hypothetical protein|nr:hypothetical protein [Ignavibacteria bacterium]